MLTLVVARARNGAIGRDGTIPWEAPEDLKLFQRETLGGAVIMGRHTWDSLPVKPLKSRLNIVVSSDPDCAPIVCASLDEAIALARAEGYFRIYGIGGTRIFEELMPRSDRILLTEVDLDVPDADTFLPDLGPGWTEEATEVIRTEAPRCTARELVRR